MSRARHRRVLEQPAVEHAVVGRRLTVILLVEHERACDAGLAPDRTSGLQLRPVDDQQIKLAVARDEGQLGSGKAEVQTDESSPCRRHPDPAFEVRK